LSYTEDDVINRALGIDKPDQPLIKRPPLKVAESARALAIKAMGQLGLPRLETLDRRRFALLNQTSSPAINQRYQRLLLKWPQLAARSVKAEVFANLAATSAPLSSLAATCRPLCAALLQATVASANEVQATNSKVDQLLESPNPETLIPGITRPHLRSFFGKTLELRASEKEKAQGRALRTKQLNQKQQRRVEGVEAGLTQDDQIARLKDAARKKERRPAPAKPKTK
jgi:hypothetical protein